MGASSVLLDPVGHRAPGEQRGQQPAEADQPGLVAAAEPAEGGDDIGDLFIQDPARGLVEVGEFGVGATGVGGRGQGDGLGVGGQRDAALYGIAQVSLPESSELASPMPAVTKRPTEAELAELMSSLPEQPLHVAMIAAGNRQLQGTWGSAEPFTARDAIEAARTIARAAGVEISVRNAEYLPWHPGRCAEILVDGTVVGHAGELHPQVCERAQLPARSIALEIDLDGLPLHETFPRPVLSPFPALLQDVAVVVSQDIPSADVEAALKEGAGELLEEIRLFDIYRSEALGEDKRSLTFSLRFRAADRTLTEEEASQAREAAIAEAEKTVGAALRG